MSKSSPIETLCNTLTSKNVREVVIFTDENVDKYYKHYFSPLFNSFSVEKIVLPAVEKSKTLDNVRKSLDFFIDKKYDRDLFVINFGGGTVCDFGGFVASVYKRGIRYVNCPTTLLAMIDASIGGKTAVNLDNVKNCIGTYHFADFLLPLDFHFLSTLPDVDFKSGMGELVKYALLGSKDIFDELLNLDSLTLDTLDTKWIEFCVSFKNDIVKKDPYDHDVRHILNFGHTVGHAIEGVQLSENKPVAHGLAVAQGLYYESFLSNAFSNLSDQSWHLISDFLSKHFNILGLTENFVEKLLDNMLNDKKNTNNNLNFTFLREIGEPIHNNLVEKQDVKEALLKFTNKS